MTATNEVAIGLKPTTPAEVAKAIVYIALSALGILTAALSDDHLSLVEILQAVVIVAGAIPVYLLTGTIPKTVAAFVTALVQALMLLVTDWADLGDVSLASWMTVVLAAFAGIGVAVVPNGSKPGPLAVVNTVSVPEAHTVQHVIDQAKLEDPGRGRRA